MNKWVLTGLSVLAGLVLIYVLIFSLASPRECPEQLGSEYYTCEQDIDCYFHPKYDCINYNQLSCTISSDLSIRQEASRMLECECENNKCITKLSQA